MKKLICYITILSGLATMTSCKKDNFDPPATTFTGRIVYQGQPIGVEQNQVRFQLWETGWQLKGAFDVAIAQEGAYAAVLFDGDFKLIFPQNEGPFIRPTSGALKDTQLVTIRGNYNLDIEVLPYYMIRNTLFSKTGSNIAATVKVEKIITDANAKNIESVSLYINKTAFVGENENIRINVARLNVDASTDLNNITLSTTVPTITPAQNFVYARVGVKIAGVEDRIYSPIQKITF